MNLDNPMKFKAMIKKKAQEHKISAQIVLQNYMMERFLERLSLSRYKQNFIVKGGFLIATLVGLESRGTMDLDVTAKGFTLSHEFVGKIFENICKIEIADGIVFSVDKTTDIRWDDEYPGFRVHLSAKHLPLDVPITVDVTTGDKITPSEIEFSFRSFFDDHVIPVMAYNLETILAEKLETILSRNVANTRPRDFYDVHVLYKLRGMECKCEVLKQALTETAKKRNSLNILSQYEKILTDIRKSVQLREFWSRYQRDFAYAQDISFDDACNTVSLLLSS